MKDLENNIKTLPENLYKGEEDDIYKSRFSED